MTKLEQEEINKCFICCRPALFPYNRTHALRCDICYKGLGTRDSSRPTPFRDLGFG